MLKNFIFKSTNIDLHKISVQLELLLAEQRNQRSDLSTIKRQLNKFLPEFIEEVTPDDSSENTE